MTVDLKELERLAGQQWLPIESAPKDGTTIYVTGFNYNNPAKNRHYCLAHFHEGQWYETSDWNGSSILEFLDLWSPLPPPPASPQEQI